MSDTLTVTGLVATEPKHIVTSAGLAVTTFRLASNQRRFDRAANKWVDGDTNWYTVASFRQLAANVVISVQKGQRVVVSGKLRVRDWETDEKKGRAVEIDADAIGHDLTWGTAAFTRSAVAAVAESEATRAEVDDPDVSSPDPAPAADDTFGAVEPAREPAEAGVPF